MEIIYWQEKSWEVDRLHLQYQDYMSQLYIRDIMNLYKTTAPSIQSIEIETLNRCNNDCSFCPVSVGHDVREHKQMSEELFFGIIDELAAMNYSGYISLFSNNEPLLDKRIFSFLRHAKEKLPLARHAMYTNGTLLTTEKFQELTKYLNYLVIDNYNDDFQLNPNIQAISKDNTIDKSCCTVRVEVRKKNQVLSNRGGLAPNKTDVNSFLSGCILPFMQMVIRPDGKVSLCCQDAYGNTTLGDVSKDGICGVWNGEAYQEIRQGFITKGRFQVSRCSVCDLFDLHNYFPDEWIHCYVNTFLNTLWRQKKLGKELTAVGTPDDVSELAELLYQHGLIIDSSEEDITVTKRDRFYILPHYKWDVLQQFSPVEAGNDFIVFQNPNRRRLQQATQSYSLTTIYGEICRAVADDRLVIFGAGRNAQRLWDKYHWIPKYYVDNNKQRYGEIFLGKEIVPLKRLIHDKTLILVAANDFSEIYKQIRTMGIAADRICNGNRLL